MIVGLYGLLQHGKRNAVGGEGMVVRHHFKGAHQAPYGIDLGHAGQRREFARQLLGMGRVGATGALRQLAEDVPGHAVVLAVPTEEKDLGGGGFSVTLEVVDGIGDDTPVFDLPPSLFFSARRLGARYALLVEELDCASLLPPG